jgi:SAM-dependent methyltransferase
MANLYSTYTAFKQWGGSGCAQGSQDFDYIAKVAKCAASDRILEIGFGAGHFLDWARAKGFRITGTEIIPEMIEAARNRGHLILNDLFEQTDHKFDVVVTLDVLEHIPHDELARMLTRVRQLLNPGGRLVARFPNGDSPFNGRYQNGDATHVKPLSAGSLAQIAMTTGMGIELAINPRPLPKAFLPRLKRRLMYAARDMIETIVGRVYYGDRFPMDPNILVVMKPR